MAQIFSLFGSIFIDNEKANKSIDETTKKGKSSSKSFIESFSSVSKSAMKIGTAVAGTTTAIVTGLTTAAQKSADSLGEIDDLSQKASMTAEQFQEWNYVAVQSGVTQEKLTNAIVKQQKAFADAKEGSSALQVAYQRLGIDINNVGSSSQAFDLVISKLSDMEDETTRNALANDIFGKSYGDLAGLLNHGSQEIATLRNEAYELGAVINNDTVTAGANFGDQIERVKASVGTFATKMGSALFPVLNQVIELILANLPTIQNMFDTLAPVLVNLLTTILPIFVDFVSNILPLLMDLINQLLPPIAEIIQQLLPIFTQLLGILLPPIIQIVQLLLPPLLSILKALLPILTPILKLVSDIIEIALKPAILVISSVANVISKVLVGAIKALTPVVKGVKKVFSDVFGGLFNIVKVPINSVINGINTFIKALNKIKIPDWVPGVGGKGINIPLIKKLRVGIDNIPYDEMPAILHKGEAVLNKEDATEYRKNKYNNANTETTNNYNNTIVIEKMEVRDDKDIKRVAEELYYLQKRSEV